MKEKDGAMECEIVRLTDRPELKAAAARWFYEKWGIADALLRYIKSYAQIYLQALAE